MRERERERKIEKSGGREREMKLNFTHLYLSSWDDRQCPD